MKKILLMFVLISFSFTSCEKEEQYSEEIEQDRVTLASKNNTLFVKEFIRLSENDKYSYFSNKLQQVETELRNNNENDLAGDIYRIRETYLKTKSSQTEFDSLKIKLIDVSEKIPDEDFIGIFVTLKNYNYKGLKGAKTTIIKDLLENSDFSNGYSTNTNENEEGLPDCNCNWGCHYYVHVIAVGDEYTPDCNPTSSGCGPLGMSGCYRVVKDHGTVVNV